MVLCCLRGDRSSRQLIGSHPSDDPGSARRHAPVSTGEKERTMLNAAYGVLAMVPVVFGVAGYTMVSR
jgi:hypothetical protein